MTRRGRLTARWRGPIFRHEAGLVSAIILLLALGVPDFGLAQTGPARQPLGLYARYAISGSDEVVTNTVLNILSNSAIAGILGVFEWSDLSHNSSSTNSLIGTTDWRLTDDLFNSVEYYNANVASTNPGEVPKTIQFEITPGFHTPSWFFSNTCSCDPMFLTNSEGVIVNEDAQSNLVLVGVTTTNGVTTNCAWASFLEAEDFANPTVLPLPLPWNPAYTNAWATFIWAVAARYNTNPYLVSVTVAGPTASSAEMILPNEQNDPTNYLKWNPIFALEFAGHPEYTNTDYLFIKAWEDAIDLYGAAFSNLTLVVTTGSGLPNFLNTNGMPYPNTYSVPPGFCPDCANCSLTSTNEAANIMDCAAETTVLAYFADSQHGGNNAKAVQANGTSAGGIYAHALGGGDLDNHGNKWLAQSTMIGNVSLPGTTNILSRVLGGAQVGGANGMPVITQNPDAEGCPMPGGTGCSNISPQQAVYNVLTTFFDGTPVGSNYSAPPIISSNFPLNYFQFYYEDVLYANTNSTASLVTNDNGFSANMTVQMLFSNASLQISQIAEVPLYITSTSNGVQVLWPETAAYYQLQFNDSLEKADGWKTNANTSAPTLTNGFFQVTINQSAVAKFYRLAFPGL